MKHIFSFLARFRPKHFRINYSPDYRCFIKHYVLSDELHPLHHLRQREYEDRKREGLWWHVTSSLDLSKSSVVRNVCRKRLRKAFIEALKERGFDEHGKLVEADVLEKHLGSMGRWLRGRQDVCLTGSVRLHVQAPLIPAKYKDVKMESGMVIEALIEGIKAEVMQANRGSERPKVLRSQWDSQPKSRKIPPSMSRKAPPSSNRTPPSANRFSPIVGTSQTRQKGRSQPNTVDGYA
ncbi:hypothetical protein K458DRAFT_413607 [Lentithecium fluviatile CBS 122367]|uniref:Uncharacterized protein n=1 Tax=Lentithecium fluviatile CBS 122367 TaxID=1168545 RepID=A0A6G1JGQ4_9PLEO|nr:hypothetical protein K458DRAFT_413607 [Lentithecium fluviatile CBS 122367]